MSTNHPKWLVESPFKGSLTMVLAFFTILCFVLCRLRKHQRRHPSDSDARNQWDMPTDTRSEKRKEQILSRLYLVTVPEDSSKIAASSIRSMGELGSSSRVCEHGSGCDGDGDGDEDRASKNENENGKDGKEAKSQNCILEQKQDDSTKIKEDKHQGSSSTISSFWSKFIRPNHDAECSICLERYEPGEVVCASKSEECNHVFHRECLLHWMMKDNDSCPLCRVDFMIDEEEGW